MKYSFFLFGSIFLSSLVLGQTKSIAIKSHSGKYSNFKVENRSADVGLSNFGVAPNIEVRHARLDSVIWLSDTTVVMVTSNVCTNRYDRVTTIWKEGKDTIVNHPLFNKSQNLDSIRTVLDQRYFFENEGKSVVLIPVKKSMLRAAKKMKSNRTHVYDSPAPSDKFPFVLGVIMATLFVNLLYWIWNRKQKLKAHVA